MKLTLHKKIAAYFGYEFIRIHRKAYQDIDSHLLSLFDLLDIRCVLDVGANMGQFAKNIRNAGYQGHIISFEPITKCYEYLKDYENENWQIINYALGSEEGKADINVTQKSVFSSILKPNQYAGHRFKNSTNVEYTEVIQVKRLDDVLSDLMPDFRASNIFLKLDTQGYDLEVLKGAAESIVYISGIQSEISCKAIYESMPTHIESLEYFDSLGYKITGIFPLSHDKEDMSLLEFDCVFKKKSG